MGVEQIERAMVAFMVFYVFLGLWTALIYHVYDEPDSFAMVLLAIVIWPMAFCLAIREVYKDALFYINQRKRKRGNDES